MRKYLFMAGIIALILLPTPWSRAVAGEELTIAAAASLRFAMNDLKQAFAESHPGTRLNVIYGSSGKFRAQIENGAPFDLYFSADINYPRLLRNRGLVAGTVRPYAVGRIVLWSAAVDAGHLNIEDLTDNRFHTIAIANPLHAPYGKRAEEALRHAGIWDKIQDRLVYGENISHTAQMIESRSADIGIIALSLALNPNLREKGGYSLIPASYHEPLLQGFAILKRAERNQAALRFASFMSGPRAITIMKGYGFALPSADEK